MFKNLSAKIGGLKDRVNNKVIAVSTAGLAMVSSGANASGFTIPAEAQAVMDNTKAFADAVLSWGWTVVGAMTIGFVGWKLVKKAANKAS